MDKTKLNLQIFGGEGGDGGSAGASAPVGESTTGDNTVDAEQQRLLELGVPKDKIRKRAKKPNTATVMETSKPAVSNEQAEKADEQDATAETTTPTTSKKMTWEEIMEDPEYNKQMQSVVQSRLKSAKEAESILAKLAPSLEILARKHGLDTENIDYEALSKAIEEDSDFYENKAMEMGVSVDTAKRLDRQERDNERQARENARIVEEEKIRKHIDSLEEQAKEMKKTFPNFNLMEELKNPAFARMTAPDINISIADAYHAVHRKEIQMASMQIAAEKTAEQLSNTIQSGLRRPQEAGTSSQAPVVSSFDYRNASKEQRAAIKRKILEAAARGEKLYPGQI